MPITLNTREVEQRLAALRAKLEARKLRLLIEYTARRIAVRGEERIGPYPPQREPLNPKRKKYRRTGTLGKSLNSAVYWTGDTLVVSWGSNVRYSVWVKGSANPPEGEKGQAWMHKGHWTPLEDEVLSDEAAREYEEIILKTLDEAVRWD